MEQDSYNGENSDFEDDEVEIDFEDQFEGKEDDKIGIGTFGIDPKEEEEPEQIGMDIPSEFKAEVAQLFPDTDEKYPTQADVYDKITEDEEPYQDGLTVEDVVPKKELEEYSDANEEEHSY